MTDGLSGLNEEQREALCNRCGTSCHFGMEIDDVTVVIEELHCRFLAKKDDDTFGCTVYAERFEKAPWCADLEQSLSGGLLSQVCPYVQASGDPDYQGKHWLTTAQRRDLLPVIRRALIEEGAPMGVSLEGLRLLMERSGGGEFEYTELPESDVIWIEPRMKRR
jgi:uncharacterized cysteine cluster protein YcgN (CxxCxxCC family)